MNSILAFLRDDEATTAVEYAVMLALILVGIITAISGVGMGTGNLFGSSDSQMAAAGLGR